MNFKLFSLLILFTLISAVPALEFPLTAKTLIYGRVADVNGNPVRDAHVYTSPARQNDVTDSEGRFHLANLPFGQYTLFIDHIGYSPLLIPFSLSENNTHINLDTLYLAAEVYSGQDIVVTASRLQTESADTPRFTNLVSRAVIQKRDVATSAELLREEPGIFIQKTNHGGGSAIIRGLSSNQILLLTDGVRLNNSTYRLGNHQYLTTVDNNSLERIEAVHGPGSVLYGSDALGGVLNLISLQPYYVDSARVKLSGFSRYATADNEKTVHAAINYMGSSLFAYAGASYKSYGDLREGRGEPQAVLSLNPGKKQTPGGFDGYDANFILGWKISESQRLKFNAQFSRQNHVPRYDKYLYNNNYLWEYHPQIRSMAYLRHTLFKPFEAIQLWETTLSYQIQEEGRRKQKTITAVLNEERDRTGTAGFSSVARFVPIGDHHIISGFDLYRDKVSSTAWRINGANRQPAGGRYPDGALYDSFGIFLRDTYNGWKDTPLILGARYSAYNTTFRLDQPLFPEPLHLNFSALTLSAAVRHGLNRNNDISFSVAQAFRAPNLSDLAKIGESKGDTYEVPNQSLQPEQMLSYDLGWKLHTQKISWKTAVYYSRIDNLISSAYSSYRGKDSIAVDGQLFRVKSKQNTGRAFITGLESALHFQPAPLWMVRLQMAYTYGYNLSLKEPVGGIPPLFGEISTERQFRNWELSAYMRFASAQKRLSTDDRDDPRIPPGGTPAWYTLNLRLRYSLSPNIRLQLRLENILDRLYREHGSGINGPGRNGVISLYFSS